MLPRYTLLIVSAVLLFGACEQPLDITIEREAPNIVIQSNFSENHVLQVVVQKEERFSSNVFTQIVTDATVKVFNGDQFLETLEIVYTQNNESVPPYYQSVFFKPVVGISYTIQVEVPGYDPIFATSLIPQAANLGDISFNNQAESLEGGLESINFEIGISFDDPADVDNYYHIIFIQEVTNYTINSNGDTILGKTELINPEDLFVDPLNGNIAMIKFTDERSFLLKDDAFDGQQISIPFKGSFFFRPGSQILQPFKVDFRTVTEDYYLYHTSFAKNSRTGGDPFSGPVVIHDNIKGGSGLFSGYNSNITSFDITN